MNIVIFDYSSFILDLVVNSLYFTLFLFYLDILLLLLICSDFHFTYNFIPKFVFILCYHRMYVLSLIYYCYYLFIYFTYNFILIFVFVLGTYAIFAYIYCIYLINVIFHICSICLLFPSLHKVNIG